jgi:hypothetical protein
LRTLIPTAKKDYILLAALNVVNTIARAVIDLKFAYSFANWLHISWVAKC